MIGRVAFVLALVAAPAAVAGEGQMIWAFGRADRVSAFEELLNAVQQHGRGPVAEQMLIQLRANRPYFLNIGDRVHFARAIDADMHEVAPGDRVVVRLDNRDGAGVSIGSGLYAVIR